MFELCLFFCAIEGRTKLHQPLPSRPRAEGNGGAEALGDVKDWVSELRLARSGRFFRRDPEERAYFVSSDVMDCHGRIRKRESDDSLLLLL